MLDWTNKFIYKDEVMEKLLSQFKPGDRGVVTKINAEGKTKRRLLDMGVTRGAHIVMRKLAPLGDPIELNVRGYQLSMRKEEAANVVMEAQ